MPHPAKKCSLRDIAKACGYSPATVSMALRNMARVPIATRERINQTAFAMGYVRDAEMAHVMSRARQKERFTARETFVFLCEAPIMGAPTQPAPWLYTMFRSARNAAHLLGYELEPMVINATPASQKKLSRKLWNQGIRGLIVGPITTWSPATLAFDWQHFACVEMGTTLQAPSLHRVERSFYDDLLELYAHLHALGYRRVGLALSEIRMEFMRYMPEATLLFFLKNHPEMQHIAPMYASSEWHLRGFRHWLDEQKPDALLVYEADVPKWLEGIKRRVPRDIGVAYLSSDGKKQSGLVPDTDLLAKEAVHLLARMVEGGEWGIPNRSRSHRFRNIFNAGKTLRPPALPS